MPRLRTEIIAELAMMRSEDRMSDECARLIQHICGFMRLAGVDMASYFRVRQHLQKTRIEVLRQIVEDDVVNVTAAQFLRTAVSR
jgi:hypothetical protein